MASHSFSLVPQINHPRSSFDLSFEHKTTFDAGKLIPVCVQEVLPGDTFTINQSTLLRFASSLVTPVMDNLTIDTQWFFVPNRLVWSNWERMMGQQDNPEDSIDYLVPSVSFSPVNFKELSGSLLDYMGAPVLPSSTTSTSPTLTSVNILPVRSYWKIYSDWYRDENLCDTFLKLLQTKFSGTDTSSVTNRGKVESIFGTGDCSVVFGSDYTMLSSVFFPLARRAKRHDYFTSALPWPQKGPGVELPLGQTASLSSLSGNIPVSATVSNPGVINNIYAVGDGENYGTSYYGSFSATTTANSPALTFTGYRNTGSATSSVTPYVKPSDVASHLQVDLTSATAITINSLRQAFQIQKFYEACARGGTRYTEIIRSFFGVVSPDARLQRSEYLGGFSQPVQIESVPQTSGTTSTSPQANLAAFGLSASVNRAFSKSFTEHGFIIGIASVMSYPSYQQGLNRMYSRKGRFDYYWTTFAHLGEQAVLNKEIYLQGTAEDDEVFGYQERYAEYRVNNNMITGQMRSNNSLSLDSWHLSQHFNSLPKLNKDFIEENPPIDRIVAVGSGTGANQFIADFRFDIKAVRVMPVYGVPGFTDHF